MRVVVKSRLLFLSYEDFQPSECDIIRMYN